jgi:hypothetical protein
MPFVQQVAVEIGIEEQLTALLHVVPAPFTAIDMRQTN